MQVERADMMGARAGTMRLVRPALAGLVAPLPAHVAGVAAVLAERLRGAFSSALAAAPIVMATLEEVRVRAGQALSVRWGGGEGVFVRWATKGYGGDGWRVVAAAEAEVGNAANAADVRLAPLTVEIEDVARTLEIATACSLYAVEEQLRRGFLSVRGGHRIGVVGTAVTAAVTGAMADGAVASLRDISGLAIRVARDVAGAADAVVPSVCGPGAQEVKSTLIVSPPGCGKTTLLRDLVRQASRGGAPAGFGGVAVTVVDERSEVGAAWQGRAQFDLGPRTDVLDGCLKAEGMLMAVRSMAPRVVATDEIGRAADAEAVREAAHAGVAVLATAHARDAADAARRPVLQALLGDGSFERVVVLGERLGRGTVEAVLDGEGRALVDGPLPPGGGRQAGGGGDGRCG